MKYRKKPVVIEAERYTRNGLEAERVSKWCGGVQTDYGLVIETLEGTMRADYGDWIIKGVKGEFYPCKPDIFEATYDFADDESKLPAPPVSNEFVAEGCEQFGTPATI